VFRSPLEIEVLAQAHRDDLQPHRSVSASAAGSGPSNGPLSRTRRAMGYSLIALGERLAERAVPVTPHSTLPLRPADGRAR
jgi:hypothetical protein